MITPPDKALVLYLRMLAGESPPSSYFELRYRVSAGTLAAEFFPLSELLAAATAVERRSPFTDVYVGCAPRLRRAGTKNDVGDVWVLWAECDGAAAATAALHHDPKPAAVIASGSGPNVHAYWPLSRPLSPVQAERANLRLAHAFGADAACFDATRILRPPGSMNHKTAPPVPVRVVQLDPTRRFEASSVIRALPEVDVAPVLRRWAPRPTRRDAASDPLLNVEPPVYVGRLLGTPARAGRKVSCPFHADERPSLHVYPTAARGWCCFSCGRGGSIYDLAGAVWGLATRGPDFREIRRRLTIEFAAECRRSRVRDRSIG